jgi:hypothetical protein
MTYNDAFQIESCQFVDAVFIKQPTLAEAQAALEGCMNSVSAKYKAKVTATLGEGELIIVVSGFIPSGSLVAADLRHALEIRKGELFGHSARVIRLAQSSEERRMSSLQFVVDRCPTIKMIRALRTTQDFIDIYGNCLREAKNLSIISVRNDPAEDLSILVYSNVAKHTIDEMNGVIRLVGDDGPVQIRVTAKKETIARSFLPAAVLPF